MYNKGTNFDNNAGNPLFNDSIGYLRTLRWLADQAHVAVAKGDLDDYFNILQSLHIEIDPRLKEETEDEVEVDPITKTKPKPKKERSKLDELREDCEKNKSSVSKLRRYHLWITRYIHAKGLGMKDSKEIDEDNVLE